MTTTLNDPPFLPATKGQPISSRASLNISLCDNWWSITPLGWPHLTMRMQATPNTHWSWPGAMVTNINVPILQHTNNSAPGHVKARVHQQCGSWIKLALSPCYGKAQRCIGGDGGKVSTSGFRRAWTFLSIPSDMKCRLHSFNFQRCLRGSAILLNR